MRLRSIRPAVAAFAVLALGLLGAAPAQATGSAQFRPVMLARHGTVAVGALPARAAPGVHAARKPFLRLSGVSRTGKASSVPTALTSTSTAASSTQQILSGFGGVGLDRQLALGSDQFVTPPDPQIAAGPNHLVEMVNSSGSIWDKQGNLLSIFDLNKFFAVPSGYTFSDPRVLFDQDSQRWFASGVAFVPPTYGSVVVLAVSTSADPTGTWVQYTADNSSTLTHDQPKIGVSSDKVVVSWNDFFEASSFQGESTWVLQKSQMTAGSTSVNGAALGPDSSRSSPVPAVQLTSNSDEYLVFNGTDCGTLGGNCGSAIGVVRISGTPLQGNVAWNESDLTIAGTSAPPAADQPGMPGSIATNDDRFLTAVWQNGVLWTGGNDACTPGGDNVSRPCSRLIQVLTASSSVNQNFDIASTGGGLYYPAFGLDGAGDMYVVYNFSSSTQYVGVRITGQAVGAGVQTVTAGQTVRAGDTTYNMNPCFGTNMTSRWGDYAGAAIDPQNTANVWVVGEYAAVGSSANGDVGCDWGTFAAQLTFTAPTATASLSSISPTSGPAVGGTSVAFTGAGFDTAAGQTVFSFGGALATSVACSSSTSCTGTSPAGHGVVSVTVTVDGVAGAGSASFSYVPSLISMSPASGPAAGGTSVSFSGTGFDTIAGHTVFSFGGRAAAAVSCSSSTSCTGTSPAGQGAVTVTVTVDGVAGTGSGIFSYVPSLSSISPTTGSIAGGTVVTITGLGLAAGQTQFEFGGNFATGVSCNTSGTSCSAATPPGTGIVSVVAIVNGLTSNSLSFRYRRK
jgi:hypothetical protein